MGTPQEHTLHTLAALPQEFPEKEEEGEENEEEGSLLGVAVSSLPQERCQAHQFGTGVSVRATVSSGRTGGTTSALLVHPERHLRTDWAADCAAPLPPETMYFSSWITVCTTQRLVVHLTYWPMEQYCDVEVEGQSIVPLRVVITDKNGRPLEVGYAIQLICPCCPRSPQFCACAPS